jgi:hypothetical protein
MGFSQTVAEHHRQCGRASSGGQPKVATLWACASMPNAGSSWLTTPRPTALIVGRRLIARANCACFENSLEVLFPKVAEDLERFTLGLRTRQSRCESTPPDPPSERGGETERPFPPLSEGGSGGVPRACANQSRSALGLISAKSSVQSQKTVA